MLFVFTELLDVRWEGWLHVVMVVLDVVVLQDRLHASALLIPTLIGTRPFGCQALFREQLVAREADCSPR